MRCEYLMLRQNSIRCPRLSWINRICFINSPILSSKGFSWLLNKDKYISANGGTFVVENPDDRTKKYGAKVVVEYQNNKLVCHCSMNSQCCHKMAIELLLNKQTDAGPYDIDLL